MFAPASTSLGITMVDSAQTLAVHYRDSLSDVTPEVSLSMWTRGLTAAGAVMGERAYQLRKSNSTPVPLSSARR